MKDKILISMIVLIGLLFVVVFIAIVANINENNTNEISVVNRNNVIEDRSEDLSNIAIDNPEEVIVEKAYRSYAWGFQYSGYIITKDGCIYKFSTEDSSTFGYNDNLENSYNNIKKIATKLDKKISEDDIKRIIKYSSLIDYSNIKDDQSMIAMDAGVSYTDIIIDGEANTIDASGESYIKSDNEYVKKIIDIINKYNLK